MTPLRRQGHHQLHSTWVVRSNGFMGILAVSSLFARSRVHQFSDDVEIHLSPLLARTFRWLPVREIAERIWRNDS